MKRSVSMTWAVLALLILSERLQADNINVHCHAQPGQRDVRLASGEIVPDGNEVRVGYFDDGFDVAVNASDLTALQDAWNQFGHTSIRTLSTQPGRFSATLIGDAESFPDQQIHLWILKTTSDGAVGQDLRNVEAHGLFSSDSEDWRFPFDSQPPPGNSVTIVSDDVNVVFGQGIADGSSLILQAASGGSALTYGLWAAVAFGSSTPTEERDPEDNPDGDDLNNGMEYLSGADPEVPESDSPFGWHVDTSQMTFTFLRQMAIASGTDTVQVSADDMNSWDTTGFTVSSFPWNSSMEQITVIVPLEGANRKFVRVTISEN